MPLIAPELGIDLGTSNTLISVRRKGIVINEPTLLIVSGGTRRSIKAVGQDAKALAGRTGGGDLAVRPLEGGTIREYEMTEAILRHFIRKAIGVSRLIRPRAVITVPGRISDVERRVVREAAVAAGVRRSGVSLVEKAFASGYGSGLPVFQPEGNLVVDIGGGTTDVALISIGGVVSSRSIDTGGDRMDAAIIEYLRHDYNILISERMAEDLKIDWGSALPPREEQKVYVRGRDLITGLPQTVEITSTKIYEALQAPCRRVLRAIRQVLDKAPPELSGDILRKGVFLMGGGAMLTGFARFLAFELGLPVTLAREATLCAAMGVGHLSENPPLLQRIGKSPPLPENGD